MKFTACMLAAFALQLSGCSLANRIIGSESATPDFEANESAEPVAPEPPGTESDSPPPMWAQLANTLDATVCEFYAQTSIHTPTWGPNLIAGKRLAPGAELRVDIPTPGQSNTGAVRAVDCDGKQVMRIKESADFAFKPGKRWAMVPIIQAKSKPKPRSSGAQEVALKFDNRCGKTISICTRFSGKSGGGFVMTGTSEQKVWLGGNVRTSVSGHCDHVLLKNVAKADVNKTFVLCE